MYSVLSNVCCPLFNLYSILPPLALPVSQDVQSANPDVAERMTANRLSVPSLPGYLTYLERLFAAVVSRSSGAE